MRKVTISAQQFSENLKQIEQISTELEQGSLELDQALSKYQLSQQLLEQCRAYLTAAEQKVSWIDKQKIAASSAESENSESDQ